MLSLNHSYGFEGPPPVIVSLPKLLSHSSAGSCGDAFSHATTYTTLDPKGLYYRIFGPPMEAGGPKGPSAGLLADLKSSLKAALDHQISQRERAAIGDSLSANNFYVHVLAGHDGSSSFDVAWYYQGAKEHFFGIAEYVPNRPGAGPGPRNAARVSFLTLHEQVQQQLNLQDAIISASQLQFGKFYVPPFETPVAKISISAISAQTSEAGAFGLEIIKRLLLERRKQAEDINKIRSRGATDRSAPRDAPNQSPLTLTPEQVLLEFDGGRLAIYRDPQGNRVAFFEENVNDVIIRSGVIAEALVKDPAENREGWYIRATQQDPGGTRLLRALIDARASDPESDYVFLFTDLDHLGDVNYFQEGPQGGDRYIAEAKMAIINSIRDGDIVFAIGGDEFVIIMKRSEAFEFFAWLDRINKHLTPGPADQIFRNQLNYVTRMLWSWKSAQAPNHLPIDIWEKLLREEREFLATHFEIAKRKRVEELNFMAAGLLEMKAGVSGGMTLIKSSSGLESLMREIQPVLLRTKGRRSHAVKSYRKRLTPLTSDLLKK